ncbi:hypothetical protein T459_09483 [Capsicum annuum]|uniref:Poly(A) polymerase nucleotidyltransferase domain-containing protein n=1 Tax=Capsicum annuum TaxID=4072 RepID=A0A2G2ZZH7_CAPAN|nr:hypothetical protein T459_09483 [Capsicum annuum]
MQVGAKENFKFKVLAPLEKKILHLYEARCLALLEQVEKLEIGALVFIRGVVCVKILKFEQDLGLVSKCGIHTWWRYRNSEEEKKESDIRHYGTVRKVTQIQIHFVKSLRLLMILCLRRNLTGFLDQIHIWQELFWSSKEAVPKPKKKVTSDNYYRMVSEGDTNPNSLREESEIAHDSLFKMMADEGLVPSPEEKIKRKNAINKLKKIVRVWVNTVAYDHALPKRYLRFASGTILTYGSYGLGVHDSELDIDPLCVGPYFAILEEDFFIVLHSMLTRRPEVSNIHCVKGAKLASRVADELGYGKHRVRYAEIKFNVVKVLKDGDLQTIGMLDYNKRLQHFFTSHLKVDSVTANAWEEEDDVVLITCRLQNPDLDAINGTEKEQQRDDFTNEL